MNHFRTLSFKWTAIFALIVFNIIGCHSAKYKDKYSFRTNHDLSTSVKLFKQAISEYRQDNIKISLFNETENTLVYKFTLTELGLIDSSWDFTFFFSKPSKTVLFVALDPPIDDHASSAFKHGNFFAIKSILKRYTYRLKI